ncbi:MAG: cysteine desulfurase NifS [Acidobacteria bacterium]|nr:MAG: cysteine desulfurase NifS [Acidobacteriota bacterium]
MIYLDHAASTPPFPDVVQHVERLLAHPPANPSGAHSAAQAASGILEDARDEVAALLGAQPREVIFTSGGSESDNFALKGPILGKAPSHIVVTAVEHHAVLDTAKWLESQGHEVSLAFPGADGIVDPDSVLAHCRPDTALVSVMLVNNETGVIQPVKAIASAIRGQVPDVLVHTDAAQAMSALQVNFEDLGVDLLTLSGHKFGGLQGTGALLVKDGTRLTPLIHGGGQELGRRAGTSNVVGYSAFAAALRIAVDRREEFVAVTELLTGRLISQIKSSKVDNGDVTARVPHITSMCFEGLRSEDLVMLLDREGVCVSGGSSCASGATEPSHVLLAMGRDPEVARGALRVSVNADCVEAEIDQAASAIDAVVEALRSR